MRSIAIILSLSLLNPVTSFASTGDQSTYGNDPVLWQTLIELNQRHHRVDIMRTSKRVGSTSALTAIASGVIALVFSGKRQNVVVVSLITGVVSAMVTALSAARQIEVQRQESDLAKSARLYDVNDPERLAARAISAINKFLNLPLMDQYELASQCPAARHFLVALNQWINGGVMNAAPPRRLDLNQFAVSSK